jgi:hypothetical protein
VDVGDPIDYDGFRFDPAFLAMQFNYWLEELYWLKTIIP